jgi:tetratricopeptide (TPR) repeat protein
LKISKEIGDKMAISRSLNNIGEIYSDLGEQDKALDYFHQSWRPGRGMKGGRSASSTKRMYAKMADLPQALNTYQKSFHRFEKLGDKRASASALGNIGNIHEELGDLGLALEYYLRSLKMREATGDKHGIAASQCSIGRLMNAS